MRESRRLVLLVLLMLLGALLSPAVGAPNAPPVVDPGGPPSRAARALALTGQRAPGGGTFTEFSDPSVNNRGDLAFGGLTTNPQAHAALYLLTRSGLRLLVAAGQPAPTGGAFRAFNDVVLNDRGTLVFLGRTTDRVAPEGLYVVREGAIVPIVAAGQPAPTGGVFTDFANPTINDQDVVAFVGRTTGPGREGIFTSSEGTTAAVVMGGQPAPTGGAFEFFLDGTPAENNRGQIAFIASTTVRSTQGVFVLTGGRVVPVVTTEDVAPLGGRFTEFGFVMLTDAGTVGFVGRTAHAATREALYVTGRATLVVLARQGQPVAGGVLTTFTNAAMNAGEEVVFQPGTPDPIPRAIYVATRSGVRPVSKARDPVPGVGRFTGFSTPALNDRGQVAFVAETDDGRHGIYLVHIP